MDFVIAIVVSYLIGSVSFSFLAGRYLKGIDIRNHGSGNAGATNTLRVLGKGPAIVVLILDVLKGMVAIWIARSLAPDDNVVAALSGLAVISGHNWPVFFRFRGGKGIATTIGVMAILAPLPALIAAILAVLIIILTRFVSLGSLMFTGILPILVLFLESSMAIFWTSLFLAFLAFVRHRSNITKLMRGTEHKLGTPRH